MEEAQKVDKPESNAQIYYVIGAVVLVVVIAAGFFLRPKPATQSQAPAPADAASAATVAGTTTPAPPKGPITKLACEDQYYNPVIGVPEQYYLSVSGVDVDPATAVDCTFTASVANQVVQTATVTAQVVPAPERNGNTFRCTTGAMKLSKGVTTKVDVKLADDQDATGTCSRFFIFP